MLLEMFVFADVFTDASPHLQKVKHTAINKIPSETMKPYPHCSETAW